MVKTYNIGAMKSRDSSSSPWENLLIQVREQYSDPESLANKALTNVKTPGLYYCPDSTTKATIYGCPADLGNVFTMAVYKVGSGRQVVQMIVSDDLMFTRRIDGATVTEWAKYSPGDSVNLEAIADEYDSSLAYDEGDYVIHDGMLYICTTDIPSGGETWNASHWKETNVVSEMNGWKTITGDGNLDNSFTATDLTGAANELLGDIGDLETIVGDGVLDSGFVATDLTGAVNELYNSGGGGGGGTSDYTALSNKPSINNVTLSGNKTASDLGLGTYSKPSGGIPTSDINSAGLDQAIASWFGNNFTMYRRDLTEYLTPRLKADTSSASIEQFVIGNLSIIRVSIVMGGSAVIQGEALTDTSVNLGIGYHSGPAVGQAASGTATVSAALRIGSSADDGVLYCLVDGQGYYRTLRGVAIGWIEDEQGS